MKKIKVVTNKQSNNSIIRFTKEDSEHGEVVTEQQLYLLVKDVLLTYPSILEKIKKVL